jgi:pimeloyl-ACP methyl ester carboxylesterase
MNRWRSLLALLPFVSACKAFFPAPAPMQSLPYPAQAQARAPALLVLLPGRGDNAESFEEHGFISAVHDRKLPVDVVAADATFGYYVKETLHERANQDVLDPLLAKGYEHVWLGGISMGGLGSLLLAKDHPGKIEGVILFAPYLGEEEVVQEVERAGGLAQWQPPVGETDYQRALWRDLKALTSGEQRGPAIYLAFGEQDRFARGHRLLAAALPPERVLRTEGKHDWPPWQKLWGTFLDSWRP